MKMLKNQTGVGMVEVLVALLVLALGVLGYAALQLRAMNASAEALSKSQAMLVMRGLAEDMRANPAALSDYPSLIQGYAEYSSSTVAPASCLNLTCTAVQMATFDAYNAAKNADQYGMKITMENCPGVTATMSLKRQCLYVFWGKTQPNLTIAKDENGVDKTTIDASSCMESSGTYVSGSSCLMMEAY